jgi:nitrilase
LLGICVWPTLRFVIRRMPKNPLKSHRLAEGSHRVAVVQATPTLLDTGACLARMRDLTRQAAARGARLVLFPETFVPGYPRGLDFGMVVGSRSAAGRALWQRFHAAAVEVPGPAAEEMSAMARRARVVLAAGVIERAGGTLYCSLVVFGSDGRLLLHHRKIKPTGSERLIWGDGDGSSLRVVPTAVGRVGGLICWENYLPLARTALYEDGLEILLAPTADARDVWQATVRHIAAEGRCFVLAANSYVTRASYPADLLGEARFPESAETVCRGGSVIVDPFGQVLAGPVWDREELLVADLDMGQITRGKLDLDVVGHYARPDLLRLERRGGAPAR